MKNGLSYMKNVVKLLVSSVFILLRLTTAASEADGRNDKETLGTEASVSETITLITSNKEMKDIMEIVQLLKDSSLMVKDITETIENETKEQTKRKPKGKIDRFIG